MTSTMNMVKGAAVAGVLMMSGHAMAALSGNVGYTSNYLWRGQTQTNDQSAISGGIDYKHDSGLYLGLWTSNVTWNGPGSEMDIAVGFSGEAGSMSYDVGYISYGYPQFPTNDFNEIYVGVGFGPAELKYSMDSANSTDYLELSADFEAGKDSTLGLHYGTGTEATYDTDYSISLSKGDFSFGISQWSQDSSYKPFVSYSQSFDF